ncbi:hypothetical protein TRIUR3_01387 [Triticum urartu]|uniref:Uncharacterized protein n=1 Tax=Triticum urartu TaxID=4572 RepID=M7YGA1_TRIUA|nr:hypothetical protein TRIUR3_01387 [Triticum urartu]
MAPASWYMTHERAHLTTPTATPPAPALLLPPTAPSTATSEPCNHNGMLLGPRVHASDLSLATAPATSVTTAVSLPPTANPFGPRLSAHGLLPATELTTTDPPPALRPLPTASSIYNPMVMERRNLALLDSLALELIDGETEADEHSMDEDDEWDLKAAWNGFPFLCRIGSYPSHFKEARCKAINNPKQAHDEASSANNRVFQGGQRSKKLKVYVWGAVGCLMG